MNPVDGRVYDDACDVGFIIVSERTGSQVLFVLDKEDMNGDDVAGWNYKAFAHRSLNAYAWKPIGHLGDLKALIIND